MQQLTIDRSKWRTGGDEIDNKHGELHHEHGDTKLLNDKGMMCCLGFFCLQIENRAPNEILNIGDPAGLHNITRGSNLIGDDGLNRPWVSHAITINDDGVLSNETREEEIHSLFKIHGFDVKFINEYPK
jgi:hypothetical protein